MKKLCLMFVTLAFMAAAQLNAQNSESGLDDHNRIEKLKEHLELSDEQVEKLTDIFERQRIEREKMKEMRKEQKQAMKKELEEILTPEQMDKLIELRKKRHEKFREQREEQRR